MALAPPSAAFQSDLRASRHDVDVRWRLQARGMGARRLASAALVWHHHRASVRGYLRQQIGYGEGETWLMREHPEQFAGRPHQLARPHLQSASVHPIAV